MEEEGLKRWKLNVTGCEAVHSGQSKHGEWTLYEVQADDEDGNPVVAKLRSFAPLTAGLKEYEAEPRDHEKFGRSWTLKDPAAKPGASDLRQRLEVLEEAVEALQRQVFRESA